MPNVVQDDPAAQFLDILPLSTPVMSSSIIVRIKERLAECEEKHTMCPSADIPSLPKRVIDVGTHHSANSTSLHLSQPNETALYIALSYCWGGAQDITTTVATLQAYTKSLPIELLPRTIQDAIIITQSLGIRYLWIDALCIVQDDQADKSSEINAMGMIYKSATLTIAAASSSSAKDGFLQNRPPPLMCQLPFYLTDNEYGSIWLRKPSREHFHEPLDDRGWTLQESLLSPRILYYATKDLIWKCQTGNSVAVQHTHDPYFGISTGRLPSNVFRTLKIASSFSQQANTWRKVVEGYSGRKLSIIEDRLPALAGIVSELQKIWKDDYMAGMWRRCLVRHLGWWQSTKSQDLQPAAVYKSPGWSWVTFDGQIWIRDIFHEEAQVLDVVIILVDKKYPFGPICRGRVVLRAPVLPGDVEMRVGHLSMDLGPDGLRVMDTSSKYLLLGYTNKMISVGLIISPLDDETFIRIGSFIGWHLRGALPWATDQVTREIITIV
jgi:hypothetical protein